MSLGCVGPVMGCISRVTKQGNPNTSSRALIKRPDTYEQPPRPSQKSFLNSSL